jgi:hypothetical protein
MIGSVTEAQAAIRKAVAQDAARESVAHGGTPHATEVGSGDPGPETARGSRPGPGDFRQPGRVEAEDFRRPYIGEGHAAASPLAGPPNQSPMPPVGRGILTPVALPGMPTLAGSDGPIVASMAAHQARSAATAPRIPVPEGAA